MPDRTERKGRPGSPRGGRSGAGGPRGGGSRRSRTDPERREAARRAEADAGRREATRRRYRIAALVVVTAVTGTLLFRYLTHPRAVSAQGQALLLRAPAAASAARCSSIRIVPPFPGGLDRIHIGDPKVPTPPAPSRYPSTPPASGPHDPVPLDAGVYAHPPPVYRIIHSLEHGAVVIWYAPSTAPADVRTLASFFAQPAERDHVIVAPYDYPSQGAAGSLPAGEPMVLVAWHHMRSCADTSLPVAFAFVHGYAAPTEAFPVGKPRGYLGDAPEAGLAI